ncbi:hypothetical protein DH2020_014657 [Rehmannia glutinosa]|uniref:Trichome birefringence-like N-terminal domain-containing protein n=1 Tax=Rehmannia glutinosa TaxID=99300 RepID=A0ABR0X068_REHGL
MVLSSSSVTDKAGPRETLEGNNNSVETGTKQIEPLGSSGYPREKILKMPQLLRRKVFNISSVGAEIPASVIEKAGSEELFERRNKSKQTEIVPENPLTVESSVKIEQTGNLSATTGKKGHSERNMFPHACLFSIFFLKDLILQISVFDIFSLGAEIPSSVLKRTGSEEHSGGDNKSKQAEILPENSLTIGSSTKTEQKRNLSAITGKKDCNYAKGKWVLDDSRPLYSGAGCKQWLSSMWACRLTQRTDFEYEKLRWQPKDCTMEEFTGSKFLQRMQDKTLAFVGDSLGRQQFQSLMCMVSGGEERPDVLDVGYEYGLVKARGAVRPDGWAYRFPSTNTTILYYWSASLCDLEPIDPSNPVTNFAMHLDRPPAFLRRFIHKFDVLVLNTGHHWNRGKLNANRWVMYVGGVPNTNRKIADIAGAKNFTVHSIVKWVNSQLPLYPGLKAFLCFYFA